ncbi:MAG: hypothetical protein Q8P95_00055 [bacterium]|nr:hypothetical protein [bacterium]
MRAHLSKNEFKFVAVSVMVLEVAAFLVFIFGTLGAILGTYSGISTTDFILLGFGGIFVALILMAVAEILQIMMRIEYNTRKENTLLKAQMVVQKAEVAATKQVVSAVSAGKVAAQKHAIHRDSRRVLTKTRTRKKAKIKAMK